MKKNVCGIEKWLRVIAGIVPCVLYITDTLKGVWGIVALIAGCILLLTAFGSYCPVNALLGINRCAKRKTKEELPPGINQMYQNPQANDGYIDKLPD
jgi:hypothetical protein